MRSLISARQSTVPSKSQFIGRRYVSFFLAVSTLLVSDRRVSSNQITLSTTTKNLVNADKTHARTAFIGGGHWSGNRISEINEKSNVDRDAARLPFSSSPSSEFSSCQGIHHSSNSRPKVGNTVLSAKRSTGASSRNQKSTKESTTVASSSFEYQELRAQLQAMQQQEIAPTDLTNDKHEELKGYISAILSQQQQVSLKGQSASPVPGIPFTIFDMFEELPGTSWRLSYSTPEFAAGSGLPPDATISMDFINTKDSNDNLAYYRLNFGKKTFGLQNIQAECSWNVSPPEGQTTPISHLVSFQYQAITTDLFGFHNLKVGLFGLLKGRTNVIQTIYFDSVLWIEQGFTPEGATFYNVYTRIM